MPRRLQAGGSADAMVDLDRAKHAALADDLRFRLLRLLEADPHVSQRDIARELGIALGRANFMVNALIDKGLIKARNFRDSDAKLRYIYALTPQGLAERSQLAAGFLRRKLAEYDALQAEIDALRRDYQDKTSAAACDSDGEVTPPAPDPRLGHGAR